MYRIILLVNIINILFEDKQQSLSRIQSKKTFNQPNSTPIKMNNSQKSIRFNTQKSNSNFNQNLKNQNPKNQNTKNPKNNNRKSKDQKEFQKSRKSIESEEIDQESEEYVEELLQDKDPQNTRILKLQEKEINIKICKALIIPLMNYNNVVELYLQDNKIRDDGINILLPAIENMQFLKILLLFDINLKDDGAKSISSIFSSIVNLETLSLASIFII